MHLRFEETDPLTGLITRWWVDPDTDKIHIEKLNPHMGDVIAHNRAHQAENMNRRWGDGQIAATVPIEIVEKHLHEALQANDLEYVRKWLNDADHRHFRRFEGNL